MHPTQNMSNKPNQQQHHNPSADIISCSPSNEQSADAGKMLVNHIIGDLEKSSPRHSERLNPPLAQPSKQEPQQSEQLKQYQSSNLSMIEDPNNSLILAMISIADQIIDPPSVEAAKKLDDWPEWETSIKTELDIHEKLGMGKLVEVPLGVNIVRS